MHRKITGEAPLASLVDAVFLAEEPWTDIDQLASRAEALGAFLFTEQGSELLAFHREISSRLASAGGDQPLREAEHAFEAVLAEACVAIAETRADDDIWRSLKVLTKLSEPGRAMLALPAPNRDLLLRAKETVDRVVKLAELRA